MRQVQRLVVKVGTATIVEESGRIDRERVERLVGQIGAAREEGVDVALVSSGAIAAGVEEMGLTEIPRDIETLQAAASVGQGILIRIYTDLFGARGMTVGQVLLTQADMTHRQQYLNARRTLERLFQLGVVPVINENDTVATEEITFGENDMLAALVAALVGADVMLLLTDTAGLFTADPRKDPGAKLLGKVERITEEIERLAGEAGSVFASGGMSSKVQAAKVAAASGVDTIIADGRTPDLIPGIIKGGIVGTHFPCSGKVASRKHWIGYAKKTMGRLLIDSGAARALLEQGGSLLPAGVLKVEGEFDVGDAVEIADTRGRLIGKGLANYSSVEAERIKGLRSEEVAEVLGERAEEMVHRDGMTVFDG